MKLFQTIYAALLFVIFSPGILFTVYKKQSKIVIAMLHSILFAFVFYFTQQYIWDSIAIYEGVAGQVTYKQNPDSTTNPNGPSYVNSCNKANLGKLNDKGKVCTQDSNTDKYVWYLPCNLSNVGIKNNDGKVCTDQGGDNYNWI
jgi:hypothetical protein